MDNLRDSVSNRHRITAPPATEKKELADAVPLLEAQSVLEKNDPKMVAQMALFRKFTSEILQKETRDDMISDEDMYTSLKQKYALEMLEEPAPSFKTIQGYLKVLDDQNKIMYRDGIIFVV
jgi:hypothetical protein